MCEAKTGKEEPNKADQPNTHSASIAVRAFIILYWEVFGYGSDCVLQLYSKVLVFSLLHDNDQIFIYGHFIIAEPNFPKGLKDYCY